MIVIENITANPTACGSNEYEVYINTTLITRFEHNREEGLVTCLRRAADSAERKRVADIARFLDEMGELG